VTLFVFTTAFRKVNEIDYAARPAGTTTLPVPLLDKSGIPLSNGLYYLLVRTPSTRFIAKLIVSK
jgi:hypothetical protein